MSDILTDEEITTSLAGRTETNSYDVLIGERSSRTTPLSPPGWLVQVETQLNSLLALPENWDSYGASAPVPEIVQSAYGFLLFLVREASLSAPYVAPTPNGGVFFEWTNGPHELEVDIVSPRAASYVYENTETQRSILGQLFDDNADDGRFLQLIHDHFAS